MNIWKRFLNLFSKKNIAIEQSNKTEDKTLIGKTETDEPKKSQANYNSERITTQIEEYKKKIKKLEEDIDDKEDEIEDQKRKNKKKDEEKQKIENELSDVKKQLDKTKEEKEKIENNKKEVEEECKNLRVSNEFVSKILNAPLENSEDIKELESSINKLEDFIKTDLKQFYDDHFDVNEYGKEMIGGKGDKTFHKLNTWVAQAKKTWLMNKKVISFIGEFSAGKTTIVNTLLRQCNSDIQLPTKSKATTAIPTYISGGKREKFSMITHDNKRKKVDSELLKVSKDKLSKMVGVNNLIKYFVFEYDNKNLQNLTILDTPGFDSNDPEDEKRTLEVVCESDALFWVVDAHKGEINRNSIKILKGAEFNKPLYIIINQCDDVSPNEKEEAINKVKKTLNESKLKYKAIEFFGKGYSADVIMKLIENSDSSNINSYMEDLVDMVKGDESAWQNISSDTRKNVNDLNKDINILSSIFNNISRRLQSNAEEAKDIPHFETHFFSSDKYEMSINDYNRLKSDLESCVSCAEYLKEYFDKQMNNVQIMTEERIQLKENEGLNKELKHLSNKLNTLYNKYSSII